MDLEYLTRFGTAMQNCMHMLRDRGFQTPPIEDDPLEVASRVYKAAMHGRKTFASAAQLNVKHVDGRTLTVWSFDRNYDAAKCRDRMVSTDQVKNMWEAITETSSDVNIVLSPNKLSPQAKKFVGPSMQVFLFDEILFHLSRHELVPKHEVVTEAEVKTVLGDGLNVNDLPLLPLCDPVTRWYDWPVGTIVKIANPIMPGYRIVRVPGAEFNDT